MLDYYGMEELFAEVCQWYDGYLFDQSEIYNPWSILNYVEDHRLSSGAMARPYWSNTSSNSIIRNLVENAGSEARGEIERLIAGEPLEKPIHEEITYGDIHQSSDNLWNFLYFTGYLTSAGKDFRNKKTYVKMVIPNDEIAFIYEDTVLRWFDRKLERKDLGPLQPGMRRGQERSDPEDAENQKRKGNHFGTEDSENLRRDGRQMPGSPCADRGKEVRGSAADGRLSEHCKIRHMLFRKECLVMQEA